MKKVSPKFTPAAAKALYEKAHQAGMAAAAATDPTPMVVQQHANPLDDNSRVVKQWLAPNGVCGFAWVLIKPGNSSFANWLKKAEHGERDEYYGGVTRWVSEFGQSYDKKAAYAHAFARVLNENGVRAQPMSRLD